MLTKFRLKLSSEVMGSIIWTHCCSMTKSPNLGINIFL